MTDKTRLLIWRVGDWLSAVWVTMGLFLGVAYFFIGDGSGHICRVQWNIVPLGLRPSLLCQGAAFFWFVPCVPILLFIVTTVMASRAFSRASTGKPARGAFRVYSFTLALSILILLGTSVHLALHGWFKIAPERIWVETWDDLVQMTFHCAVMAVPFLYACTAWLVTKKSQNAPTTNTVVEIKQAINPSQQTGTMEDHR
jgi:hypothetical protein